VTDYASLLDADSMSAATPYQAWAPLGSLPVLTRVNLAVLAVGLVALAALLFPLWRSGPDLSHGFAAPLLFFILLAESRGGSHPRFIKRSSAGPVFGSLALVLGALGLILAGVYGSALGASNAMACFFASGGLDLLLLSAWMSLADETVGVVSFGWPAVVALALWPLSSPLPPGSYARLLLWLQGGVTEAVTNTLESFGVAAYRDGNVIELAHTRVGVSEACSGVQSLAGCVMAGLFLSAVLIKRPWARVVLIVLAPLLALLMNFLRLLILTLIANRRGDIGNGWHDGTGFAIIGLTTVLLGAVAFALKGEGKEPERPPAPALPRRQPKRQSALALTLGCLAVLLAALTLARRPGSPRATTAPDVEALFPAPPEGWQVRTDRNLAQSGQILQTALLARKTYSTMDTQGPLLVTFYVAYWLPHQASASLVAVHTPDFCWPGTGWSAEPLPQAGSRTSLSVDGRTLPAAECRLFSRAGTSTYVWFWHLFAGKPLLQVSPYSVPGLTALALAYDLRRDGDQLFVVVSSNRAWDDVTASPAAKEFFKRVAPLGI
jgi:exosortase